MKGTAILGLDDTLYRRAKAAAALEGITLTRFIDEALELLLQYQRSAEAKPYGPVVLPPFASGKGFDFGPDQLKRLLQESQLDYDLAKLERR